MYARTGRVSFSSDRTDAMVEHVRQHVVPMYEDRDGFRGFRLLVDRQNGTALGVSYWDTEAQLHATDEISEQARSGAAEAGEGGVEGVEVFEIVIDKSV